MNFLKNNKKLIAGIAIGVLTTTGIGYAANEYLAGDIRYTKSGASSSISVAEALNELYANKKDVSELNTIKTALNQTTATANDILSGKKAYTGSGLVTGSYQPITTTKGTEWNSENGVSVAKNINSIDVGFVPTKIVISLNFDLGNALMYNSSISTTKGYNLWEGATGIGIDLNSSHTSDANIRTVGTTVTFYTNSAVGYTWFAVKQ